MKKFDLFGKTFFLLLPVLSAAPNVAWADSTGNACSNIYTVPTASSSSVALYGNNIAIEPAPAGQPPTVCGAQGYNGADTNGTTTPGGGGAGSTPAPFDATIQAKNMGGVSSAISYISIGGNGGFGGNGDGGAEINGRTGGTGAVGGTLNIVFDAYPGQDYCNSYNTCAPPASSVSSTLTSLYLQSIGGNGGQGGSNGGNGGVAGPGGSVTLTNNVALYTTQANGFGILAQSLGGWGGNGTDSGNWWGGGNGGTGSAGASGGSVFVTNNAVIQAPYAIPIFAQSIGGNGGNGGDGSTTWFQSGSGGVGGYGGPGGAVWVFNKGGLYSRMTGSYGIFAQSVGGGGGNAGSSAGLIALGAAGGDAASGSGVIVNNAGSIILNGSSSAGIFAQSIGGGGGAGGMASGKLAVGGSGGNGGDGSAVWALNSGTIYTGASCSSTDSNSNCLAKNLYPYTAASNGGAFGILAQSIGGGGGSGGMGIAGSIAGGSLAIGGSGGGGGNGYQVYVSNSGSIYTTESNSAAILAQSIGGGGGSGGGAISLSSSFLTHFGGSDATGGNAGAGGAGGYVGINCPNTTISDACSGASQVLRSTLTNGSLLNTYGVGSPGIIAQSIGGGGGNGGHAVSLASSIAVSLGMSFGGTGGNGGLGSSVYVSPNGLTISTAGSDSPGVLAMSIGGGGGHGGQSVSGSVSSFGSASLAVGGTGGNGGSGGNVYLDNSATSSSLSPSSIATSGDRSYGLSAQSIGGGGGNGGSSYSASFALGVSGAISLGGQGGNGGTGGNVTLQNAGAITTTGSGANAILAQSIGGGGGNGGMSFSGSGALGYSNSLAIGGKAGDASNADSKGHNSSGTVVVNNNGALSTSGTNAPVILAQSIGGGGGNGGMSGSAAGSLAPTAAASVGGTGGAGGNSGAVYVTNYASLTSIDTAGNDQGILAQSVGGGGGNGGGTFATSSSSISLAVAVGGSGGGGGDGGTVGVNCYSAGGSYSSSSAACHNTNTNGSSASGTTISTASNHSSGILAMSVGGGGGTGGFSVSSGTLSAVAATIAIGGTGGNGGKGSEVYASNAGGDISTKGVFSSGLEVLSVGGGGGRGGITMYPRDYVPSGTAAYASAGISVGGSGGNGGSAGNVIAESLGGSIATTGTLSSGIFAASVGGRGGHGGLGALGAVSLSFSSANAIGGNGGTGNTGGNVLVNNAGSINTSGILSHGIEALSIGGGGGSGGWSAAGIVSASSSSALAIGGTGGSGGGSGSVTVNNNGSITTSNIGSTGITALSIGGGGGNGGTSVGVELAIDGTYSAVVGGKGGGGAQAGAVSVTNSGKITSGTSFLSNIPSSFEPPDITKPETKQELQDDLKKLQAQLGSITGEEVIKFLTSTGPGALSQGIVALSIGGGGGRGGFAVGGAISGGGTLGETIGGGSGDGGSGGYVSATNSGSIVVNGNFANAMVGASIGGRGGMGGMAVGGSLTSGIAINDSFGGDGGKGGGASNVDVLNTGSISTQGFRAIGMTALSQGGNGGMGGIAIGGSITTLTSSSTITLGGSGGNGGAANTANVDNRGSVSTIGPFSSGLVAQSLGGDGGIGGASVGLATGIISQAVTLGGQGGNGAAGGVAQASSTGSVNTIGPASLGVLAQSIGGNGGMAGLSIAGLSADKALNSRYNFILGNSLTTDPITTVITAGSGENGGKATASISGSVATYGALAYGVVAESIGGGGGRAAGSASFSIFGTLTNAQQSSNLTLGGMGGNGGDAVITLNKGAQVVTQGLASDALYASSVGGGGGNAGLAFANLSANGKSIATVAGGSEGSAGDGGAVTVDTSAGGAVIATTRAFSDGIFAQSIGGGGGTMSALHSVGGAAGILEAVTLLGNSSSSTGGSGGLVNLNTGGSVTTYGPGSTGILGQSIGGGGGQSSSGLFGGTTTIAIPDTPLVLTVGSGSSSSSSGSAGSNPANRDATLSFSDFSSTTLNSETAGAKQLGGYGKSVGNGGQASLVNGSVIFTYGSLSDGIKLQSIGGGGGVSYLRDEFSGSPFAGGTTYLGGGGTGGGNGSAISSLTNNAAITTDGSLSVGILAQSIGGGGGDARLASLAVVGLNNGYSSILGAKNGAAGGIGQTVAVTNNAQIVTAGQGSDAMVAQSIGGGGGFSALYGIGQNASSAATTSAQTTSNATVGYLSALNLSSSINAAQAGLISSDPYRNIGGGISTIRGASFAGVLGSSGAANSAAGAVNVNNNGSLVTGNVSDSTTQTMGYGAQGIIAQSVGGGGGILREHLLNFDQSQTSMALMLGGIGSVSGSGADVTVNNNVDNTDGAKAIMTNGASSMGILAQSIGGGGGFGILTQATSGAGGSMSLALMLGNQVSAPENSGVVNVTSGGQIVTKGDQSEGIVAQSISGGGGVVKSFSYSATSGSVFGDAQSGLYLDPGNLIGSAIANRGMGVSAILGGSSNNGNNAYSASVTNNGSISTYGNRSTGIVAQSINGGGGLLDISAYNLNSPYFNGAFSLGGTNGAAASNVAVVNNGSIITQGNLADGILAQSISSGGGSVGVVDIGKSNATNDLQFHLGSPLITNSHSGDVAIVSSSSIQTSGFGSNAITAQSIGGGGGLLAFLLPTTTAGQSVLNLSGRLGAINTVDTSAWAAGQTVNVISTGNLVTAGTFANGIVAQSISGGGGLLVGNQAQASGLVKLGMQGNGGGNGGAVNVTTNGWISTSGVGAIGVIAQSIGGGGGLVSLPAVSNVQFGGSANSAGDGGTVNVAIGGPVTTIGNGAIGVLAQSIGGGGGAVVSGSTSATQVSALGGYGNGGNVTVNINAPITTTGTGAYGVIAQSIAGGGGVLINPNGASQLNGAGGGTAGTVNVVNASNISVSGVGAKGIFASNAGQGVIDPSVTITRTGSVLASGGASAIVLNGAVNTIQNSGVIAAANASADSAVDIRGGGSTTNITNNGYFFGAIRNQDSGLIQMANAQGGKMFLANSPNLGAGGNFVNAGYLQFAHPTLNSLSSFTYRETLNQTATGVLGINFNFKESLSELIKFDKKLVDVNALSATNVTNNVTLGGNIHPVLIQAGLIAPGSSLPTQILDKGGDVVVRDQELGVINTAIMSYGLIKDPSKVQLTSTANFTPAGLSAFGNQLGSAIGTFQTAGSNAFFQAATAQLVTIPTVGALDQAYTSLAGTAIQAMPQANYQAVTRAVGTVSDRMNSWRVGDSFIATTKNPRALMSGIASMNQPITPNAPQVANGTLSADGGQAPISLAKKSDAKTWITPFGGTSNSNNLATQIYGGSLGIEAESDDRTFIGGAAVTVSQSNYTYSSTLTPATPGYATNYGAQFYFGARHEAAYLSAIGYLGGSSGNFTRQLQALGFNTTAGVNIHSNIMGARVEAGYNLLPNLEGKAPLQITPFVALQPTQIRQNGANETFGIGSGFYYGSNINTAVPLYLGTEISGEVAMGHNEVMKPFLRVSWAHDLMSPMTMNAAYTQANGPTLYANGTPTMGNMVILKGGAKYNWGTKVSAYATIDVEQGNAAYSYRGIGGSIGAIYSW